MLAWLASVVPSAPPRLPPSFSIAVHARCDRTDTCRAVAAIQGPGSRAKGQPEPRTEQTGGSEIRLPATAAPRFLHSVPLSPGSHRCRLRFALGCGPPCPSRRLNRALSSSTQMAKRSPRQQPTSLHRRSPATLALRNLGRFAGPLRGEGEDPRRSPRGVADIDGDRSAGSFR